MTVSPPPTDTDRLAEVLAGHVRLFGNGDEGCSCGWGPGRWRDHAAAALAPVVSQIAARRAAEELTAAAWDVEQLRPHIPPSTDPDRRTRVVQRSSFNRAASAVRARAAALVAAHPDHTTREKD